jgi:hypothetical protein
LFVIFVIVFFCHSLIYVNGVYHHFKHLVSYSRLPASIRKENIDSFNWQVKPLILDMNKGVIRSK